MQLSVVTVTYNSKDTIAEQVRSVRAACEGISCEQIVVDNGSTDGTVEPLPPPVGGVPPEAGKILPVRVIENTGNRGFAAANNQGVKIAAGEFLLFLNPDMKFLEGERLSRWIDWMRLHRDVGISGCKLTNEKGVLNMNAMPRRLPRVLELLAGFFKLPRLFPKLLDGYLYRDKDFSKEQEVDSVRGSCMLVRRELIEKLSRAFDERYFIWFEDVDLCREAKRLGFKVVYTPVISCIDLIGQSFKRMPPLWKQWHFWRSAARYVRKWGLFFFKK
jgi:hypothetical protein